MKRLILLLLICGSQIVNAQVPQYIADQLNNTFDSICGKHNIKGASAAIYMPNYGTWKRSFGVSYAGKPINEDMIFSLGSNTKTYTSAVLLKLHQEGLLSINDTIGKWLINVPNVKGSITIKQLLQHTSGIESYTANGSFWDSINANLSKKWTPEEILPFVGTPLFAPGSSWSYSNTNYLLAGIIIKKVLNKSLAQAYHQYIFTPLNLGKTILATEETTSLTYAHRWSVDVGFPNQTDWDAKGWSYDAMNSVSWAAGGLYATAEDNAMFFDGLFNKKGILADSMIIKMRTTKSLGGGVGYGLGLFTQSGYNGHTIYSHGGTNAGAINENVYDPVNGCVLTILTNQDSIDNNQLQANFLLPLHKDLLTLKVGLANITATELFVKVYPNPSEGGINIELKEAGPVAFTLYDISGKEVSQQALTAQNNKLVVEQNPGLYFYSIQSANGSVKNGRLVIVK